MGLLSGCLTFFGQGGFFLGGYRKSLISSLLAHCSSISFLRLLLIIKTSEVVSLLLYNTSEVYTNYRIDSPSPTCNIKNFKANLSSRRLISAYPRFWVLSDFIFLDNSTANYSSRSHISFLSKFLNLQSFSYSHLFNTLSFHFFQHLFHHIITYIAFCNKQN